MNYDVDWEVVVVGVVFVFIIGRLDWIVGLVLIFVMYILGVGRVSEILIVGLCCVGVVIGGVVMGFGFIKK